MITRKVRVPQSVFPTLGKPTNVFRGSFVSVRFYGGTTLRVAAVISKKVSKTAVLRNRVRRVVYAAMHELIKNGTLKGGTYIIDIRTLPSPINREIFFRELQNLLCPSPRA